MFIRLIKYILINGTAKIVQWVKVLGIKPNRLSLILGTPMEGGENQVQ